jgi:VAD1 Analog of StAR-related lipid transfer domain
MSDSSDFESGSKMEYINAECDSMHEGRQLIHTILPLNIETIFGLMFHKSKFFNEFHKMRKTTNLKQGEWEDLDDGTKKRVITLTVAITQLVGPKSSHVTETQIMRKCSVPGVLYSIDGISENAGTLKKHLIICFEISEFFIMLFTGIPYADCFSVVLHYCMKKSVDDATVMSVHAQIKYKKVKKNKT